VFFFFSLVQIFLLTRRNYGVYRSTIEKPDTNHSKKASIKDNKVILWFQVEEGTGCGMNLSTKSTQNRPCGVIVKSI